MEDVIDVLISMGATQVIYNETKLDCEDAVLSFNFNGKECAVCSGATHSATGFLTCDVSDL